MNDMAELFARDPLKLTKEDIDTLIVELRRMRENFIAGAKSAGSLKTKSTAKPAPSNLSLKDLGLE